MMKSLRRTALLVALVTATTSVLPAQSAVIEKLLTKVTAGEHTEGDQQVAKINSLAACSLNNAIAALALRDSKGFQAQINETLKSVEAAERTISQEMMNRTHGKQLNLAAWRNVADLDLTGINTQRDLLGRILTLVQNQRKALENLRTRGTEEDLAQAVAIGGQISRMLTVYLTA